MKEEITGAYTHIAADGGGEAAPISTALRV